MERIGPQGVVCPCPGDMYMYITIIIKHLLPAWPIKAKFLVESPWGVGKEVYINGTGYMTKMASILINGKNVQKSSPTELTVL